MHVANVSFLSEQTTTDPGIDHPDGSETTEGIMTV